MINPTGARTDSGRTSVVRTLAIAPAGRFDLADNGLVVDYAAGGASPLASVRQMILAGFIAGGAAHWSAGGLTSGVAQTKPNLMLGYAEASEAPQIGNLFGDVAVDGSAVLVRTTLAGDANLNGKVDFNDLVKLAQNYNTKVSTTTESWWTRGDFNYDGSVDFNDLVKLAQNYNTSAAFADVPGATADFKADFARALAEVPEPNHFALAALAAWGLASRRRRTPSFGRKSFPHCTSMHCVLYFTQQLPAAHHERS
jgi:hypothetical protein